MRKIDIFMESMIHQFQFTPAEMLEAVVLASIPYEIGQVRKIIVPMPQEVELALTLLARWRETDKQANSADTKNRAAYGQRYISPYVHQV